MVRKLVLCVVGALYLAKSVFCIAAAMLISIVFLVLHFHYYPYKSEACNRLQSW
jgi:hypothetical protein